MLDKLAKLARLTRSARPATLGALLWQLALIATCEKALFMRLALLVDSQAANIKHLK